MAGDYRPSYVVAALVALAVFVLYVLTLAPTTAMWDASEYIAAVKVLGLPHPPGNPLFILIGHVAGMIPVGSYAQRINLMAALASALTAGLWFLVTERVLAGWGAARLVRRVGGALAAVIGATAFTVWNQSVVNEKVYTVALLFLAAISWLVIRWMDAPEERRADRLLLLVAYLAGLGYTVHPAGFLAGPAVGAAVLALRPGTLLRWRLLGAAAGALLLGLTPFLFEPIRAAHFPRISLGEPTACVTEIGLDCTLDPLTADRLIANIRREQYGGHPVLDRQAPISAQIGMFWLYFKWQWLRDSLGANPGAQLALALTFLGLGLYGGVLHWKRDRRTFWYVGPLMLTLTLVLIYYLNFKYGYSQAPELADAVPREVRDRDYFYLWSFSAWGIWAALGLVGLWQALAGVRPGAAADPAERRDARRRLALAAPVLLVALVPLVGNWKDASRAGETTTREWAHDLLNSVEPYGVLITNGDNDTFPLWYAQEVEGIRQDVTVLVSSLLGTDWNVRQLIRNPVRPYDAAAGPAIYRGREWPVPDGPPLDLTIQEADALPAFVELPGPQRFRSGGIDATIAQPYLTRDQIVTLRMIRDAFPERPIYFSSPHYPRALGLGDYLLRQGVAVRLVNQPVVPGGDTVATMAGPLDLERTRALWRDVYRGPAALVRQGDWVDQASVSIPMQYVFAGSALADALEQRDPQAAARVRSTVGEIAEVIGLQQLLGAR